MVATGSYHEQSILVSGFLGGISLTALVIVLQYAHDIQSGISLTIWGEAYYVILIAIFGGSSMAFIFSCVASMPIAGGVVKADGKRDDFSGVTYALGLVGLLISVPMLIFSLSKAAGTAIAVFNIILFYYFFRAAEADDLAEEPSTTPSAPSQPQSR